jgi:ABC-type glutathione transport system ATPase component
VLDEWLGAGDASFQDKAAARMERFVDTARMVIIASHDTGLIQRVCNKVCVLQGGRIGLFRAHPGLLRPSRAPDPAVTQGDEARRLSPAHTRARGATRRTVRSSKRSATTPS